jgi:hypothetical protein
MLSTWRSESKLGRKMKNSVNNLLLPILSVITTDRLTLNFASNFEKLENTRLQGSGREEIMARSGSTVQSMRKQG